MDYTTAFEISGTGMQVQMLRLDVVARNLANTNSLAGPDGQLYRPMRVIAETRPSRSFQVQIGDAVRTLALPSGVDVRDVSSMDVEPRRVYEPSHPAADADGFLEFPNINPVAEMLELIAATRAYEANVRAMNAAKTMALRAIEIGRNS